MSNEESQGQTPTKRKLSLDSNNLVIVLVAAVLLLLAYNVYQDKAQKVQLQVPNFYNEPVEPFIRPQPVQPSCPGGRCPRRGDEFENLAGCQCDCRCGYCRCSYRQRPGDLLPDPADHVQPHPVQGPKAQPRPAPQAGVPR